MGWQSCFLEVTTAIVLIAGRAGRPTHHLSSMTTTRGSELVGRIAV
jgi:hypothetical protein